MQALSVRDRVAAMLELVMQRELDPRVAAALALALGAATCLVTFGVGFVTGHSPFWTYPVGDAATQLEGYRFFVADHWHFPLLRTVMIQPPHGLNALELDVIPLIALPGKALRSVLGAGFNPYGWWLLACYALEAYFGMRLVRALGHRTIFAAAIASVFALTFHPFILRFFHLALNGQFVILWALCRYLELAPDTPWRRRWAAWSVTLGVALLIHPYLFAMALAIFGASSLHGGRGGWRPRLAGALAVLVTIFVLGTLTGHFSHRVLHGRTIAGYGLSSLNLGSLVEPSGGLSALAPHGFHVPIDMTGMQWDGALFLGFGVLILIAAHLVRSPRQLAAAVREHAALSIVFAGLVLYAVGTPGYCFHYCLWHVRIPHALRSVTNTLRANGRLAWPFGFFVVVGVVGFTLRRFSPRVAAVLLVACAALEIVDARPAIEVARTSTRAPWPHALDWDAMRPAIAAHARVDQWPSYQCLGGTIGMLDMPSRELQFLAALEARSITGVRAGRPTVGCAWEREQWTPLATTPGALSVYVRATSPAELPPTCKPIGPWVMCTELWASPALARLREIAAHDAPAPYAPGAAIDPSQPAAAPFLTGGWEDVASRLSIGARPAHLRMLVRDGHAHVLVLDGDAPRPGVLSISAGGVALPPLLYLGGKQQLRIAIPAAFAPHGVFDLVLHASGEPFRVQTVTLD